jgi:hypothetical protein
VTDLDVNANQPELWINELLPYQQGSVRELLQGGQDYEEAAKAWLTNIGAGANAPFGSNTAGPGLFDNLKTEFNKLVCGDPAYADLRKQTAETWEKYKPGILMTIAAAIGAALGVAAVVLVPAVALLLTALSTVGVNAWCATKSS